MSSSRFALLFFRFFRSIKLSCRQTIWIYSGKQYPVTSRSTPYDHFHLGRRADMSHVTRKLKKKNNREIVLSNELTDASLRLDEREKRNLRAYRSLGLASRSVALVITQRDF